jgi:phage FluMu protein Com
MKEEEYPKIDPLAKVHLTKGAEKIKVPYGKCPRCYQKNTFVDDDNITVDTMLAGERILISHLRGIRCANCNELALDPESTRLVEELVIKSERPLIKFKRKVTLIAKRPAIYLPKDLLASMGIKKLKEVVIYPRSRRSVVVEFA